MNSKDYLDSAKHLDNIGAFSISDEIDNELIKIAQNIKEAQSWKADPNLPEAEQGPIAGLENIGRAYVGSWQRAFGLIEFKIKNNAVPNLNAFIISDYSKEPGNRDFQVALYQAKEKLEKEFGFRKIRDVRPNWELVYTLRGLKDDDKYEVYKRFTNWVNYQRQILGNSGRASAYLRALKNAENIIAKKIDPSFTPSAIRSPTRSTPGASGGGGGTGGGGASGGGRATPKPTPSFDTNKVLFAIVYRNTKSLFPDVEPSQFGSLMPQIYEKIASDEELKVKIYQAIESSSYSTQNKAKLKKKLDEKLKGETPTPGPTPEPEPGPTPGPEPGPTPGPTPSPFVSEQDVKAFPFLYQQINDLDAKSDEDFFKIFLAKHNILNRQIMASYDKRNLKPEEYSYLSNFLDRLELRYQNIQQGLR